jgi:outer membrane protein TolC
MILTGLFLAVNVAPAESFELWPFSKPQPGKEVKYKYEKAAIIPPRVTRPKPISLPECYDLALRRSEMIAMDTELIKQAEAHYLQALGIMLPLAGFQMNEFQQDTGKSAGAGSSFGLIRSKSSEASFVVTQQLFNGFKEIAAMAGSKCETSQRAYEREHAEQRLLVDVVSSFYLLAEIREDLAAIRGIKGQLAGRICELRDRASIGRSRYSEVVEARTQLYRVRAQMEVVKNREAVARNLLEFMIGEEVGEIAYTEEAEFNLSGEKEYLAKIEDRPNIQAAIEACKMWDKNIVIAASGSMPTVTLEGNYYTQRTGFYKGLDWDGMININVPFFEGTETIGAVKQAISQLNFSKLELERKRRLAVEDIRDAYINASSSIEIRDKYSKALESSKLNYKLQQKDYDMSLISNLDVLSSLRTFYDSKRDYIQSAFQVKRAYFELLFSVGEATKERLSDII